jgi:putative FmdB family regulatory protein
MMPIYEYECEECGNIMEVVSKISEKPEFGVCDCCGGHAKPILSRGAIHTDGDVKWLQSAREVLQPDGERPIETRGEYNRYLKDNNLACIG